MTKVVLHVVESDRFLKTKESLLAYQTDIRRILEGPSCLNCGAVSADHLDGTCLFAPNSVYEEKT